MPHTLTRRPVSNQAKGSAGKSQGVSGTSQSPSAIKAAAKSAALQLARQKMTADEDGSDDDLAPENYFSLSESSSKPVVSQKQDSQDYVPTLHPSPGVEDAPLDFDSNAESYSRTAGAMQEDFQNQYQQYPELPDVSAQVVSIVLQSLMERCVMAALSNVLR